MGDADRLPGVRPRSCRAAGRCRCACATGGRSTSPSPRRPTKEQGARCMDCGIPFCHEGCPLGNLIPEWNDLVYRDDWSEAIERLHATNNFPEFTGRLCPAPCEAACVLGINDDPVTIERIEYEIVERAWAEGWVDPAAAHACAPASRWRWSARARPAWPRPSSWRGPATAVTVFERAEKPGGLLRYGIPEFKMEKAVLDRRLAQMEAEGVDFRVLDVGRRDAEPHAEGPARAGRGARRRHGVRPRRHGPPGGRGASRVRRRRAGRRGHPAPGPARCPGASSTGIHLAMDYLKPSNLVREGALGVVAHHAPRASTSSSSAAATPGPTASAPCTARVRPRCTSSRSCPSPRATGWPTTRGRRGRSSCARPRPTRRAGERLFSVTTTEFVDDGSGAVRALRGHRSRCAPRTAGPSSRRCRARSSSSRASWCCWPWASSGTERRNAVAELGVEVDPRGTVAADARLGHQRRRASSCAAT